MDAEMYQKILPYLLRWSFGVYYLIVNVMYHIVWFVDTEKKIASQG